MNIQPISIGSRRIGPGEPVFIIAEAGVNHNGDLALARQLIDVAAEAGADAVKFQSFKLDETMSEEPDDEDKDKLALEGELRESVTDYLRKLELTAAAHQQLQAYCRERGILFLSTPFDMGSVDLLDSLDVPLFKIGSGEITNWPLLANIARRGKPILLSTGTAYLQEVMEAVQVIQETGNEEIVVLHCVSNYPANPADANLRAMGTMAAALQLPVGYSDHTPGIEVALAAVALGACVIEKHFTLDRNLPGPDHRASLEPDELHALVAGIRTVEAALGDGRKVPVPSEALNSKLGRRSLVAACPIPAGTTLTEAMISSKRPATGLPPTMIAHFLGRRLRRDVAANEQLAFEMLA